PQTRPRPKGLAFAGQTLPHSEPLREVSYLRPPPAVPRRGADASGVQRLGSPSIGDRSAALARLLQRPFDVRPMSGGALPGGAAVFRIRHATAASLFGLGARGLSQLHAPRLGLCETGRDSLRDRVAFRF